MINKDEFLDLMNAAKKNSQGISQLEDLLKVQIIDTPLTDFFYQSTYIFYLLLEVGDDEMYNEAFHNSCWAIIDNFIVEYELKNNRKVCIRTPEEFYTFWFRRTKDFPTSYRTITSR